MSVVRYVMGEKLLLPVLLLIINVRTDPVSFIIYLCIKGTVSREKLSAKALEEMV